MNNDIIGKEVVFYENNTWNHIIKEINLYTYTIEYGIKRFFRQRAGWTKLFFLQWEVSKRYRANKKTNQYSIYFYGISGFLDEKLIFAI